MRIAAGLTQTNRLYVTREPDRRSLSPRRRALESRFYRGDALPDPNGVLEGKGEQIRHIEFTRLRDLAHPFVRLYIRAAMDRVVAAPAPALQKKAAKRS